MSHTFVYWVERLACAIGVADMTRRKTLTLSLSEREMAALETLIAATEEISGLRPNIDFMLAAICHLNRLPATPALVMFAAGRLAGWLAHALEQQAQGRLIRPRARYTGITPPAASA